MFPLNPKKIVTSVTALLYKQLYQSLNFPNVCCLNLTKNHPLHHQKNRLVTGATTQRGLLRCCSDFELFPAIWRSTSGRLVEITRFTTVWKLWCLLWFTMAYHGLLWLIMVYYHLLWFTMIYVLITMIYSGLLWFILVCYGLRLFIMVCHGLPWFSVVYRGLPWFTVGFYGLPWVTMV